MKLHPYCAFFEQYLPGPLKELADDIKANGQRDDILKFPMPDGDGEGILDGRNRFLACEMAGVEPRFKEFEGTPLDALNYVRSKNFLPGRYITPMQRAETAVKFSAEMARLKGAASTEAAEAAETPSQREVADLFGLSRSTLQRAKAKQKGSSEPPEPPSWTIDEIKKDESLFEILSDIAEAWSNEDAKAIRTGQVGLTRAEIVFMAQVPVGKLPEIRDLVMSEHWKPRKAFEFVSKMPTDDTTIQELKYLCRATVDQIYKGDFDGFTVTVVRSKKR